MSAQILNAIKDVVKNTALYSQTMYVLKHYWFYNYFEHSVTSYLLTWDWWSLSLVLIGHRHAKHRVPAYWRTHTLHLLSHLWPISPVSLSPVSIQPNHKCLWTVGEKTSISKYLYKNLHRREDKYTEKQLLTTDSPCNAMWNFTHGEILLDCKIVVCVIDYMAYKGSFIHSAINIMNNWRLWCIYT